MSRLRGAGVGGLSCFVVMIDEGARGESSDV